jgi:hypothetical protein
LAAANAQGDDAAFETVAAHRVDKAGGQHCARRADRMAMRNGATLDIDDILRQTELARYGKNAIAVSGGLPLFRFSGRRPVARICRIAVRLLLRG